MQAFASFVATYVGLNNRNSKYKTLLTIIMLPISPCFTIRLILPTRWHILGTWESQVEMLRFLFKFFSANHQAKIRRLAILVMGLIIAFLICWTPVELIALIHFTGKAEMLCENACRTAKNVRNCFLKQDSISTWGLSTILNKGSTRGQQRSDEGLYWRIKQKL